MMTLNGSSTIYKHPKASTLYLTIPSKIACDSQFNLKKGDKVNLKFDPKSKSLVIKKRSA